ncbi:hypothetical protein [Candidatus Uabimicrobium sp. HlEnr_7]|uniref:hypothetical protein n=1 Tax=Candidatus Uabimicrobium helgolandensis TaxID=3095367 RepID=UPI0035579A65
MRKIVALFFQFKYIFKWQWLFLLPKVIIVVVIALLIEKSNFFSHFYLYDRLMNTQQQKQAHVIIVEIPQQEHSLQQWLELIQQLHEKLLVKKIVLNFIPHRNNKKVLRFLQKPYIFFVNEKPKPRNIEAVQYIHTPLPVAINGICRDQKILNSSTQDITAITNSNISGNKFLINFNNRIIRTTSTQILSKKLISQLTAGKIILLAKENRTQIYTPLGSKSISLEEYQAYAINSLINKTYLKTIPKELYILLLIVFVIVCFAIHTLITGKMLYINILFSLLLMLVAAILFFDNYFLPILPFVVAQITIYIYEANRKNRLLHRTFQKIFLRWSDYLKNSLIDSSISLGNWSHSLDALGSTLGLEKYVFLKKNDDSPYLEIVRIEGCEINDVIEKRRDCHRSPYDKCYSMQKSILLKQRSFFKQELGKNQYLVPLIFSQHLLGFLACSKPAEKNEEAFEFTLNNYSHHLSEFIYQKDFVETKKLKSLDSSSIEIEKLRDNLEAFFKLIRNKFIRYSNLINLYSTPTILYSITGRPFYINQQAIIFFKKEMISIQQISLTDLITKLGGYSKKQSQKLVVECIFEQKEVAIPIDLINNRLQLKISPLITSDNQKKLESITCELVAKDTMKSFTDLAVLTKKMGNYTRSELSKALLSISLLRNLTDSNHNLIDMVEDKISSANSMTEKCEYYLNLYQETEDIPVFPVDSFMLFEQATKRLQKQLLEKHIAIVIHKPSFPNYSLAGLNLQRVFFQLLLILVQDAQKNSKLNIFIEEAKETISYHFCNIGIGMPNDLLQSYLTDEHPNIPEEYKSLSWCTKKITTWRGNIQAKSHVGMGMEFIITMDIF